MVGLLVLVSVLLGEYRERFKWFLSCSPSTPPPRFLPGPPGRPRPPSPAPQWGSAHAGERPEWEWCGWLKLGWMGVGVGSMCPEWLKGGRWPMCVMWPRPPAPPNGELLSCMHLESSSKPSPARLPRLLLLDILRLRVWMPSFFMVSGLFTCRETERRWLALWV